MNEKVSILIVEDDRIASKALRALLASFSCHISTAPSYQEASELLDQHIYQIIFLDLGLPDKSGIELSKKIRQRNDENRESYLIGITGFDSPNLQYMSINAGMNCCFLKPIRQNDVNQIMAMTGYMSPPTQSS